MRQVTPAARMPSRMELESEDEAATAMTLLSKSSVISWFSDPLRTAKKSSFILVALRLSRTLSTSGPSLRELIRRCLLGSKKNWSVNGFLSFKSVGEIGGWLAFSLGLTATVWIAVF